MSRIEHASGGRDAVGVHEHLHQDSGEVGVDKPEGFINKYGSPGAGGGVDKPPRFINTEAHGGEEQVELQLEQLGAGEGLLRGNLPSPRPAPRGRGGQEASGDGELSARRRLQSTVESSFGAGVNRGGRPEVITDAVQDRICTLLSVGFSRRQAAAYVDIDQSTIHRTAKRDPEFADRLRRAEERATLQPMLTVISEAQKNWRAAVWLLKHKANQPVVQTEEEKQEMHEQRMADARRSAEVSQEWHRAMSAGSPIMDRIFPPTTAPVSQPVQTVKVTKSGKGKRQSITRTVTTRGA